MKAEFPVNYQRAVEAIRECNRVDECKEWASRSAAIASYFKQANDREMIKIAKRIRCRAVRRLGELLREASPRTNVYYTEDLEERRTIESIPERTRKTAEYIADIPEAVFEAKVESDNPIYPEWWSQSDSKKRKAPPPTPSSPELRNNRLLFLQLTVERLKIAACRYTGFYQDTMPAYFSHLPKFSELPVSMLEASEARKALLEADEAIDIILAIKRIADLT